MKYMHVGSFEVVIVAVELDFSSSSDLSLRCCVVYKTEYIR